MIRTRLLSHKWLIVLLAGLFLFLVGLFTLHHNPYWRYEPGDTHMLHHRVYAVNGIGHLTSAIGLLSIFLSLILLPSRLFSKKWLYWMFIVVVLSVWYAVFGVEGEYGARYAWEATRGITEFTISSYSSGEKQNRLWQDIVRWQVEPELRNWLGMSPLKRTHGSIHVSVIRIVPIAHPALDCDCFNCCVEEDKTARSTR